MRSSEENGRRRVDREKLLPSSSHRTKEQKVWGRFGIKSRERCTRKTTYDDEETKNIIIIPE